MNELLVDYLKDACTPERKVVLLEACEVLTSIGVTDHDDYIDQLLALAQDGRTDDTLTAIENTLYTKYTDVVNSYSIITVDDISLRAMCHLVWGLSIIEHWADPQLILDTLDASSTSIDALCDILGLLTEESSEEWFTLIITVAPTLIERIRETLVPQLVVDALTDDDADICVQRVNRYHRYFQNVKPVVLAKALTGLQWRINYALTSIPEDCIAQIARLPDDDAAATILGFTALSSTDDTAFNEGYTTLIERIYSDVNTQHRIMLIIVRLMKAATHG